MTELPDAEDLLLYLLRTALTATVSPDQPADLLASLPYVMARRVGGRARHQRWLDVATVDIQAYASTRREASALCRAAGLALFDAWDAQTVTPYGHLASFAEVSGASELPSGIPQVWRFQATHSLSIRP